MLRIAIAGLALAVSVCSASAEGPTNPYSAGVTSGPSITVGNWDPGGSIDTYEMWWKRIARSGINVRINGSCVSACSMVLGLVPLDRVCITRRGKFGIHMASLNGVPDQKLTRWFVKRFYPKWVQDWIKTKPPLTDDLTWLTRKDIGDRIKPC